MNRPSFAFFAAFGVLFASSAQAQVLSLPEGYMGISPAVSAFRGERPELAIWITEPLDIGEGRCAYIGRTLDLSPPHVWVSTDFSCYVQFWDSCDTHHRDRAQGGVIPAGLYRVSEVAYPRGFEDFAFQLIMKTAPNTRAVTLTCYTEGYDAEFIHIDESFGGRVRVLVPTASR